MSARFCDRTEAGQRLAQRLAAYANRSDVVVLGLPRGGVVVAYEIARALNTALDIFGVRKLGVPNHRELAFGAIATGGIQVLNPDVLRWLGASDRAIQRVIDQELQELQRREQVYRGNRPLPNLCDRTVILVDDGIATGATVRAAISGIRTRHPKEMIVAVPVVPAPTYETLITEVDRLVCLATPKTLHSISAWYEDFSQVSDAEVRQLLSMADAPSASGSRAPPATPLQA
ncbi:MAG: phosphoribosyltransferase [Cyanobacteria bacterium J06648_16]